MIWTVLAVAGGFVIGFVVTTALLTWMLNEWEDSKHQ